MRISASKLDIAGKKMGLTSSQTDQLWQILQGEEGENSSFSGSHLAYYAGGLILMIAAALLCDSVAKTWGYGAVIGLLIFYASVLGYAGRKLYVTPAMRIPGGVLTIAAVLLTPIIIWNIEQWTHFNDVTSSSAIWNISDYLHNTRMSMAFGTLIVGSLVFFFTRFPPLSAVIIVAFWHIVDAYGISQWGVNQSWAVDQAVCLAVGGGLLPLAAAIARRSKQDYGFWLYGAAAVMLNIAAERLWEGDHFWLLMIYGGFVIVQFIASILMQRRVFAIVGALGIVGYIFHLASYFGFSSIFAVIVALVGLGVVVITMNYQKLEAAVRRRMLGGSASVAS